MILRPRIAPFALLVLLCVAGVSCSVLSPSETEQQSEHPPFTLALAPTIPAAVEAAPEPAQQEPVPEAIEDTVSSNTLAVLTLSGTAYWYGPGWHGKRTACGEIFNSQELTAAHPFLPFGTMVRIQNLGNQRETIIRITDRCGKKPTIDVSEATAKVLGFHHAGTAKVQMTVVQWPENYDPAELIATLNANEEPMVQRNKVSIAFVSEQDAGGELPRKFADHAAKIHLTESGNEPASSVRSKTRRIRSEQTKTFFAASEEKAAAK